KKHFLMIGNAFVKRCGFSKLMTECLSALHPGLRASPFVHGSGENRNVDGTSLGDSSGTTDFVLRPRLRRENKIERERGGGRCMVAHVGGK
ncbi:MAG: hypothetical protein Q4C96_10575, partial [Planctomycetia bacterium]|nr:hypothetical protein [Planctomycetia bacterium]